MKQMFSGRFINLILRAFTILLKFILSIIVIKKLSVEDYGVLGLLQSTVIIITFIVGLDFYTFNSREILKQHSKSINYYLSNQFFLHLICYIIILPLSYLLFKNNFLEKEYFALFCCIVIVEHLSQELYRFLILIGKTISATMVLFIRSGLWVVALYVFWEFSLITINVTSILILWMFGAFLSILLGFYNMKYKPINEINIGWIIRGIKISFPFFIGTIFYKLIEFSGRYFLKFYFTEEKVGVFTFFSGIANIMFVFVQTIVIIELYPKLIEAKYIGLRNFNEEFIKFKKQMIRYTLLGFALSIILIYPILLFLDKSILMDNILPYIILLFSTGLFCLSFISHYALYAYHKDLKILKATFISFCVNIVFSFLLIPKWSIIGAALTQLLAFLAMYIAKYYYWDIEKQRIER